MLPTSLPPLIFEKFIPEGVTKPPVVIVLHGSEGTLRFSKFTAQALAKEGFAAYALQYFGGKDQKKHLVKAPLDPISELISRLKQDPSVDGNRIYLLGVSRGSEAAMSVAELDSRISKVVGVAVSPVRYQGFIDFATECKDAAFSYKGKELPYALIDFRDLKVPLRDKYVLAMQKRAAWVDPNRLKAKTLLLTGGKDVLWPCDRIVEKWIAEAKNPKQHTWENYANAGHVFFGPPGGNPAMLTSYGGTKFGSIFANQDSWKKTLAFLKE